MGRARRRADILLPVTPTSKTLSPTTSVRRVPVRAAALLAAVAMPVLAAAPAVADVPEGWSDPDPVSPLHALLVLGAVPLALFLLIALAVYVPGMVRGERVSPGGSQVASQWFGGPRGGTQELEARDGAGETGGASGRW
jgi:hypothetical protein